MIVGLFSGGAPAWRPRSAHVATLAHGARRRWLTMWVGLCSSGCPQMLDDEFVMSHGGDAGGKVAGDDSRGDSGAGGQGGASGGGGPGGAGGESGGPGGAGGDAGAGGSEPSDLCGDQSQNQGETGVDCGGPCAPCPCAWSAFTTPELVTGLGRTGDLWGANLSFDGLTLTFAESDGVSLEKVFAARRDEGAAFLAATELLTINTANTQGTPFLTADGLSLYFYSERNAVGQRDIYVATRSTADADFGAAALVTNLNTAADDEMPWLSRDQLTIFFSSDRTSGNSDIFIATRADPLATFGNVQAVAELTPPTSKRAPP
jgi:WD40-like Beta Propeller Repeat